MEYTKTRRELAHICHKIYERGYTQASGGNVSCRIPGTELFAIKKTAVNMSEMTEEDVLVVDGEGQVVYGEGKPSKEVNFHLGIMKVRPDVNAVVHCHPCFSVAFANAGLALPQTTVTSRKVVGPIPCVEAAPAGSRELRDYVVEAFEKNQEIRGVLMKQHGICTVGTSLMHAYNIADLIEGTAKQAWLMMDVERNRSYFEKLV